MRPDETKQDYAMRRTWLLIKTDIPDKHMAALKEYIDGLSEKELDCYVNLANNLYDRRTLGARSIKVTSNAVKMCIKLAKCGYKTFPHIEKLATKGWDTAGGTYSFSMPLLTDGVVNNEIFSFGPINELVKESTELDVGYSEATRALEVDYK
jgi:hypothetical protein